MVPSSRFTIASCALVFALACTPLPGALAEETPRAARLLSFEGTTQVFSTGESKESAGDVQVNMPLLEGTQLRTADDGRSEVEFEDGSIARVTPNSQISLDSLGQKGTEVSLVQGLAYFELRDDFARPYAVRYGANVVKLATDSTFRINLDTSPGELSVFSGEVVVATGEQKIIVRANETLHFDESSSAGYVVDSLITPDSWDQWNDDQHAAAAPTTEQQGEVASRQESGSTYGWSDLDAYGDWYQVPDVGTVWQPSDAGAGFEPYALGGWGWYPGYGYTWISGYPWGWTPFHCGGWNYFEGFGWGWLPGSCYGWLTSFHFRHPPFGFRPPVRPIAPPITVVRVKHPILPHGSAPVTPTHPVLPVRPVLPVHRTAPALLNGELVSPLPRRPIVHQEAAGEGSDSPLPSTGSFVTRETHPASPVRPTGVPVMVAPVRVNPPPRPSAPIVVRPVQVQAPMSVPVHSSPGPVMPPSAPHVMASPAVVAPSHR